MCMGRGSKQTNNEDIMITVRKMLKENGYQNISMRDIAKELGISVGNLTYYYKNKQQLMEAIIFDKHSKTQKIIPAKSLEELENLLTQIQKIQEEQLYYFKHYSEISMVSDSILGIQKKVYHESTAVIQETFENLFIEGLIKKEQLAGQIDILISTILFISIYWHERDFLNLQMEMKVAGFKNCIWGLIYPCLTEKGKEIYFNHIHHILDL